MSSSHGGGENAPSSGGKSFVAGLSLPNPDLKNDAASLLQLTRADNYDFCIIKLPMFPPPEGTTGPTVSPILPLPRSDVIKMESKWWSTSIVGEVDPSVPLPDDQQGLHVMEGLFSSMPNVRKGAEKSVTQMLQWAVHMSIPAVILPSLPSNHTSEQLSMYARLLASLSAECCTGNVQLWVRVPFDFESLSAYDALYHLADMPPNVGCVICFGGGGGTGGGSNSSGSRDVVDHSNAAIPLLHKFVGCNTRAISFNSSIFLTNKRGYPTFSKSLQTIFTTLLRRLGKTLRVVVEGGQRHFPPPPEVSSGGPSNVGEGSSNNPNGGTGCLAYLQYLRHLRSRAEVVATLDNVEAEMEAAYLDQLQSPLQPLADDLDFTTYETFEKDPVKYASYQTAIECCVQDLLRSQPNVLDRFTSPSSGGETTTTTMWRNRHPFLYKITIMVVGAGRGPLIEAAFNAVEAVNLRTAETANNASGSSGSLPFVKPHVIAVEKNLGAVLFLKSLQRAGGSFWNATDVTIVHGDIRHITPTIVQRMNTSLNEPMARSVDIVVSELLGSFGDNELSPECLQACGTSGLVKERTAISIPQTYVSYLAPVSSMRLHAEAKAQAYNPTNALDGPGGQPLGILRALETPYVVRPYAASQTSMEQPCFEFRHAIGNLSTKAATATSVAAAAATTSNVQDDESDSEKFIQILFPSDPSAGAGCGCGYGPFDSAISLLAAQNVDGSATQEAGSGTTIHGLLGSFEALLYQPVDAKLPPVTIGTAPSRFSKGMFSWFPLFFPLKEAMHVPAGAQVKLDMWRKRDGIRVWYEWCVEVVSTSTNVNSTAMHDVGEHPGTSTVSLSRTPIHNPNGRSYHVSLSS